MDDRIEALQAELATKVSTLRTSEEWLDAMAVVASFHQYSFHNWMLMWAQGEQRGINVTRPAGYRAWQGMNRYVRKGEKALKILAPMMRKYEDERTGETGMALTGFRVVNVFDISQTDGQPLPDMGAPVLLEGEGDTTLRLACEEMIADQGFTMEWAPLHGPNGTTNHRTKEVRIEESNTKAQQTKTTVHELAHVLAHDSRDFACRGQIEVEAESIAYVVCKAAGLDTDQYSVRYVAGWAEETDDPTKAMMSTAETVVKYARQILEYIGHTQAQAAQDAA